LWRLQAPLGFRNVSTVSPLDLFFWILQLGFRLSILRVIFDGTLIWRGMKKIEAQMHGSFE